MIVFLPWHLDSLPPCVHTMDGLWTKLYNWYMYLLCPVHAPVMYLSNHSALLCMIWWWLQYSSQNVNINNYIILFLFNKSFHHWFWETLKPCMNNGQQRITLREQHTACMVGNAHCKLWSVNLKLQEAIQTQLTLSTVFLFQTCF